WLRQPLKHPPLDSKDAIQLWFSSNIDKEDVILNIKDYIRHLKREKDYYEKEATVLIANGQSETAKPLDRFYWDLVVKEAIAILEFRIKLSKDLIKKIKEYEEVEAEK